MITHHPAIDRLSCFAAGNLPLNQALCISAHVDQCRQCRREMKRLELVGADMFVRRSQPQRIEHLKESLLARLDQCEQEAGATSDHVPPVDSGKSSKLPACLRQLLPEGIDGVHWKRLSPSIQGARLCTDVNGARVELLKIKPGGQVASHNHSGEEITLVLQGSFSDAYGVYGKGDIVFRDKKHKYHHPIASQDSECICLTSVEKPMQFTGWFARLFNPLIRRDHYAS